MPSLVWSTVALLGLLLPGFLFFAGLYSPERYSRDLSPRNPLGTLAAIVFISFFAHVLLLYLYPWMGGPEVSWAAILDAVQMQPPAPPAAGTAAAKGAAQLTAERFQAHALAISGYVLLSGAAGFVAGWLIGTAAVYGWMPFLVEYPWAHNVKTGAGGVMTYAHVLTDLGHDDRLLMYRGRIRHFSLSRDGAFETIVLAATEQRFLRLDKDHPYLGPLKTIGEPEAQDEPSHPGLIRRVRDRLAAACRRSALRRARDRLRLVRGLEARIARPESRLARRRHRQHLDRQRRRERTESVSRRKRWGTSLRERLLTFPIIGTMLLGSSHEDEGAVMVIPGGTIKDVVFQGTYRIPRLLSVEEEASEVRTAFSGSREALMRALEQAAGGVEVRVEKLPVGEAQRVLHAVGLYQGRVDGVHGSKTAAAIELFQRAHGLEPTGRLDAATSTLLRRLGGSGPVQRRKAG